MRVLVLLSGVLEFCVRMGCDDASLIKYFPKFIIKISGLIVMDPNTFLNVLTLEYETTASSRIAGSQLRTFYGSLLTKRMDTSGKILYFWNPQENVKQK